MVSGVSTTKKTIIDAEKVGMRSLDSTTRYYSEYDHLFFGVLRIFCLVVAFGQPFAGLFAERLVDELDALGLELNDKNFESSTTRTSRC